MTSLGRPVGEAKATLAGLAQLFLEETARANRNFAKSQMALAASLGRKATNPKFVASLGGRARDSEDLLSALRAEAKSACRLAITEVNVTFWAEPAPLGFWERVVRLLSGRGAYTGEALFRLVPAERRAHAVEYVVKISPTPNGALQATNPVGQATPLPALTTPQLMGDSSKRQSS